MNTKNMHALKHVYTDSNKMHLIIALSAIFVTITDAIMCATHTYT